MGRSDGLKDYSDPRALARFFKNYADYQAFRALYEHSGRTKTTAYRNSDVPMGRRAFYNRFDRFRKHQLFEHEAHDSARGPKPYESRPAAHEVMEAVDGNHPAFFNTLGWRTAWQEQPPEYGDHLEEAALRCLGAMATESNYRLLSGLAEDHSASRIKDEIDQSAGNFRNRWQRLDTLALAERDTRSLTRPGRVLYEQIQDWEDRYGVGPVEVGRAFYTQEPPEFLVFLKNVDGVEYLNDIQQVADVSQNVLTKWLITLCELEATYRDGPTTGQHITFGRTAFGDDVLEFLSEFGRDLWKYNVKTGVNWVFKNQAAQRTHPPSPSEPNTPMTNRLKENIEYRLRTGVSAARIINHQTELIQDEFGCDQSDEPTNGLDSGPGGQTTLDSEMKRVLLEIAAHERIGCDTLERAFPGLDILSILDSLDEAELVTQDDGYETLTAKGQHYIDREETSLTLS